MDNGKDLIVSKRIKELRKSNHLTVEKLAEKIGVSKSTISKWENGQIKNLKQDNIKKLAETFNVSPTYIMAYGHENKKTNEENERQEKFKELYMQLTDEKKSLVDNMIIALSEKQ